MKDDKNNIVRFGVSIENILLKRFDSFIQQKGYINRSEALRDLIRDTLASGEEANPDAEAVGTLTFIYSHDTRELSERLNELQHSYYGNIISATHIHLDKHMCMEVLLLKGKASEIREVSDRILAVKNIKFGKLAVTPLLGL